MRARHTTLLHTTSSVEHYCSSVELGTLLHYYSSVELGTLLHFYSSV